MTRILSNEDRRPVYTSNTTTFNQILKGRNTNMKFRFIFTSSTWATISSRLAPASAKFSCLNNLKLEALIRKAWIDDSYICSWKTSSLTWGFTCPRECMHDVDSHNLFCTFFDKFSYVSANKPTGGWLSLVTLYYVSSYPRNGLLLEITIWIDDTVHHNRQWNNSDIIFFNQFWFNRDWRIGYNSDFTHIFLA